MGRMKRSKALSEVQRARVVDAITMLHSVLNDAKPDIRPDSPDAVALVALTDALHTGVQCLTGRKPAWMDLAPAPNVWCGLTEEK